MKTPITAKQVWSYIFSVAKPFPLGLSVMVSTALIWSLSISLKPYSLKLLVDLLTITPPETVFSALAVPILLYLGAHFFVTNVNRVYGYFVSIKMIPKMRKKITTSSVEKLLKKSHTYYQNNFSGSLTNKVNDLVNSVPDLIQVVIDSFFSHFLALVIAVVALWQVHYIFSLMMIIWTTVCVIGIFLFSRKITKLSSQWSEHRAIITGKIVDILSNILSIRLFSGQKFEKKSLKIMTQQILKTEQDLEWGYFWLWVYYGTSALIIQIFSFYLLCKGYGEKWISIGDFVLVIGINNAILDFLREMARDFSQFSKLYGRAAQALSSILTNPDLSDLENAPSLEVMQGKITFDAVSFQYKGPRPLFENLSITIEAGQKVGLVGYSGGGKTTFVNLILRLYDLTAGRILIDDQDIASVTQESLRSKIGMIPQDPSLFHRTLKENIHYGSPDKEEEAIIQASKQAHTHEFILKLQKGYDALVGERGIKLSGGQRQRIAIARAILKNAPILILDEATSQLDSLTETGIQNSLWELMQGKTALVVAHRLSTLLNMDRILVFDHGKIIEDGSHQDLLKKGGLYKTLWEAQVGGFLHYTDDIHPSS